MVNEAFSQYITPMDMAGAITAGVVAYIRNSPKADDEQQPTGAADSNGGEPTTDNQPSMNGQEDISVSGADDEGVYGKDWVFSKDLSDTDFLRQVTVDKAGRMSFGNITKDNWDDAILRYCQLKKIPCSKTLAGTLGGVLQHGYWNGPPASVLNDPTTMKFLTELAGNSAEEIQLHSGTFWSKIYDLPPDKLISVYNSCKGSAEAGRKLCDMVFGKLTYGKQSEISEVTVRMMCGQIQKSSMWRPGDGMLTITKMADGSVGAF